MEPQEFKTALEGINCEAKRKGFTDEQILIEYMEQVRYILTKEQLKVAARCGKLS